MKIKFQFENIVYSANSGDSIASALISNKIFEINNNGLSKRGIFCGMGVCHECLVEVNGENKIVKNKITAPVGFFITFMIIILKN